MLLTGVMYALQSVDLLLWCWYFRRKGEGILQENFSLEQNMSAAFSDTTFKIQQSVLKWDEIGSQPAC